MNADLDSPKKHSLLKDQHFNTMCFFIRVKQLTDSLILVLLMHLKGRYVLCVCMFSLFPESNTLEASFISVLLWYLTLLFLWVFLQLSFSITVTHVFYLDLSNLPLVIDRPPSFLRPERRLFNRTTFCIVWLWRRRTRCWSVSLLPEVCGLNLCAPVYSGLSVFLSQK